MIAVTDYYTTKFGELWNLSLYDLVEEALQGVLQSSLIEKEKIDAVFYGNMLSGVLENNLHSPSKISEFFGNNIPVYRCEAACASGGVAFHLAYHYLLSHKNTTIIVLGAEKMTDHSSCQVVTGLSAAASGEEQETGLTFPGLYGLLAQVYLNTYGYSEKNLAYVSVKNHYHGTFNQNAQFNMEITIDDVLKSSYVAEPLKVLDSSPISDGASALILSNDKKLISKSRAHCTVLSTETASDSIGLNNRRRLDELEATKIASKKACKEAGISIGDINVAEVHDCFSIAELLAMEDLGFWKKGTAGKLIINQPTQIGNGNGLTVNTSGGLKAAGHPVGATGVKQIGEIYLQLTGQAVKRQVKGVRYGLAHNIGGSGGVAVVTILGN